MTSFNLPFPRSLCQAFLKSFFKSSTPLWCSVDASGNVAFRVKKRHSYFSSLAISLFSLLVDKKLRHPVAILPNRRQKF
jgi:hypothetical protein